MKNVKTFVKEIFENVLKIKKKSLILDKYSSVEALWQKLQF